MKTGFIRYCPNREEMVLLSDTYSALNTFYIGWLTIGGGSATKYDEQSPSCTSTACVRAAARLLARLDPSIDPCSNFYQFSCGRFLETYTVPDDSNQLSTLQEMQDEMLLATRSNHKVVFFL